MVGKFADVHEVICHSAHDFSRFVCVVEGIRQSLELFKHIASHLSLHFYAHNVSLILHKIVEHHTYKIQSKEHSAEGNNHFILFFRYQVIKHFPCNNRVNDSDK